MVVFYRYIFGDFSIFAGWDALQNLSDYPDGSGLGLMLAVVLPFFVLLASITWGFVSFERIKNPQQALDDDYD
jgi:hypothetical protein